MTSRRAYRSSFEEYVGDTLVPAGFSYEPYKLTYWMPGNYTPDFVLGDILVECKGWFRPGDQKKYLAIRDALEGSQELVFLLQYPNKRVRKGAKMTMGDWCDKNDIPWFATPEEVAEYAHAR